eukprot:TRINITY_DN3115_c0_g3_i1.p1 TRINITY_DN3115_c0_g3~~TRINITY_DN3115_c0_g3_i1.p1  ORF type:complete len:660 (+),score=120.99 TRINITY_DN3115_c0_g3_i1:92-1981(+)
MEEEDVEGSDDADVLLCLAKSIVRFTREAAVTPFAIAKHAAEILHLTVQLHQLTNLASTDISAAVRKCLEQVTRVGVFLVAFLRTDFTNACATTLSPEATDMHNFTDVCNQLEKAFLISNNSNYSDDGKKPRKLTQQEREVADFATTAVMLHCLSVLGDSVRRALVQGEQQAIRVPLAQTLGQNLATWESLLERQLLWSISEAVLADVQIGLEEQGVATSAIDISHIQEAVRVAISKRTDIFSTEPLLKKHWNEGRLGPFVASMVTRVRLAASRATQSKALTRFNVSAYILKPTTPTQTVFTAKTLVQSICVNSFRNNNNNNSNNNDSDEWLMVASATDSFVVNLNSTMAVRQKRVLQCVESHPTRPWYFSGGIEGHVQLSLFSAAVAEGEEDVVATFRTKGGAAARVAKIHCNRTGTKLGACDHSGTLTMWRCDTNPASRIPFISLQCHSASAIDFAFLNSGSFIASVGRSADRKNVALYDLLLPQPRVVDFVCHEDGGAHSVVYSPRHQVLISGGKDGVICLFDVRQQRLRQTVKAHSLNVKALVLAEQEHLVVSGSTDGGMKVWRLPDMLEKSHFENVHEKKTFVNTGSGYFTRPLSTYGVMDMQFVGNTLYTCGADARVLSWQLG